MTTLLGDGRLGPGQRTEGLRRMERGALRHRGDVGGVVGCGAALDAASRGLSVALVEGRYYEPRMGEDEREALLDGWHRAVGRSRSE